MESLLSSQVQSGNLTQDQADTLKSFFESLATKGPRGTEGPNGPRPPRDQEGSAEGVGDKDGGPKAGSAQASSPANDISKAVADALAAFLKNLQESSSSSSAYGASAKASTTPPAPSLVIDKTV